MLPASQQLRNTLYHDYDAEPRYKRYQSVDYAPQNPVDYSYDSYEPQRFGGEDPFQAGPTPRPLSFDTEVASFLPPPSNFAPEHRGLPEFDTSDYYYKDGGEYYPSDYHVVEGDRYPSFETEDYGPDYGPDHLQHLDAVSPDFHTTANIAPLPPPPQQPQLVFGDKTDINANQFINVAAPDKFEHGHVRGNQVHKKQEYTRREGRQFKSQVSNN